MLLLRHPAMNGSSCQQIRFALSQSCDYQSLQSVNESHLQYTNVHELPTKDLVMASIKPEMVRISALEYPNRDEQHTSVLQSCLCSDGG